MAHKDRSNVAKAVIYARISQDATGEAAGVQRQRQACLDLCEQRGWQVVDVIVDNSVSATARRKRPGWEQVLGLVRSGKVDVIVGWSADRFYRRLRDLEDLLDLTEATGVTLATVSGEMDLSTASGQLVARILASVARQEVQLKGERQQAAHRSRAQAGKPWWATRPFGFERDGSHREAEAEALRQAYRDLLAGQSLYAIAKRLNAQGLISPRGNPWASRSIRQVILNGRNAAIHTYRGQETGQPATWQAIVPEDIYRAVVRKLSGRKGPAAGGKRKGLLSSVATCGVCGAKVRLSASLPNAKGERYRTYQCSGDRRCVTHRADFVDRVVLWEVVARAEHWRAPSDETDVDISGLQSEQAALRERKTELGELFADGQIDRATLLAGTVRADTRLAEIHLALAEAATTQATLTESDVRSLWSEVDQLQESDPDRLRAIIERLCESITLLSPGKGARYPKAENIRIAFREDARHGRLVLSAPRPRRAART